MSTVIKIVGQITLKALTDVRSTTYYYLLQSSMAAAPSKPTTNPPTGGWSTTEPEFFIYMPTQDTTIISGKDYYTRSGEEGSYIYTKVLEPSIDDISNYYEKIYGDTRSLYVTVQTLYTDDTFDYSEPSLSSSYEAAKEAYNRAKTALDLAGDTNQYFWSLSSSYSTDVPAGVYVTHIPQSQFKSTPAQGNVLMQNTGLTIRNGAIALASLTGNALNFYSPTTHNSAVQLSRQALNFYSPSDDRLALSLDSSGLNFYGSSTVNPDASLTLNGLMLKKGGIKAGTDRDNGFVYLSSEDYQLKDATHNGLTINGHTPTAAGTDGKTVSDPAWREIIGTKFAVDSDGNLYANNAHLSEAHVDGDIVAQSLTIGSGGGAYDGAAAINISGYDIVIYEDNTDESIVDHDNTTYLYPVMYHNGEIDETVDNTHYIWYVDDGNIGTIGDATKGGIIASYGHNYRVVYDFDGGAVGGGTEVQTRTVDPSKYITKISDTGITIHPEVWNNESSYIQLDGTGMELFDNSSNSIAQYGRTARIGFSNSSRFLMNSDSLQAYNSSNAKYFEVSENGLTWGSNTAATTSQLTEASQTAAQTATNYIKIDGSGIKIQSSGDATDYLYINSDKIAFFRNGIEKMQLTDSSLRLGDQNEAYTTYTNSAIEFYNTSDVKTVSIENGAFKVFENNKPIFRVGTFDSYFQGVVIGDGYLSPTCLSLIGSTNTTPSSTTPIASVGSLKASADESEYGSSAQLMLSAYSGTDSINHYINIYAASGGWSGIEASTSISINSDERLKENFQSVGSLSDILFTIQPVIYSWKDKRTGQRHLGFKAQDIQQALSVVADDTESFGLVNKNRDGYLNLSYTELIPLLVDVIQKHEKRIIELETQLSGGID